MQYYLKITSYLFLSQNPYTFYPNQFPPNFFLFLLPMFINYVESGFNLFMTIQFMKLMQMFFSLLTGYLSYLFILHFTNDKRRAILGFTSILFSPILFFVNFIQLQQPPIGVMFTLMALYTILILAERKQGSLIYLISGSILIWYSAFLYLIPIAIIPTLIVYQRGFKRAIKFIVSLIVGFLTLYLPFTTLNLFNLVGGTSSVSTTTASGVGFTIISLLGPNLWPPDHLQYLLKGVFNLLFLGGIIAIPVIMRIFNRQILVSITLVFISLFLLISISSLDDFSWLVVFLIIFVAIYSKKILRWSTLFMVQLYYVPFLVIYLINDSDLGTNGSGIFYLSYLQFHINLNLWQYPLAETITKISIFLGFLMLIILSFYVFLESKTESKRYKLKLLLKHNLNTWRTHLHKSHSHPIIQKDSLHEKALNYVKTETMQIVFVCLILVILFSSSLGYGINLGGEIHQSKSNYPFGFFSSGTVVGDNITYDFTNNFNSILIYPQNTSYIYYHQVSKISFKRNLTNEVLSMNLSIKPINTHDELFNSTILDIGNTSINVYNRIYIPNSDKVKLPNKSKDVQITYKDAPEIKSTENIPLYTYNGTSYLLYNLNTTNFPRYGYYLFFHAADTNLSTQNQIFFAKIGNTLFQFYEQSNSKSFVLSYSDGNVWKTVHVFRSLPYLDYLNFYNINNTLYFNINNYHTYTMTPQNTNYSHNILFFIGKDFNYSINNNTYALHGFTSPLIQGNLTFVSNDTNFMFYNSKNETIDVAPQENTLRLQYSNQTYRIMSGNMLMTGVDHNSILTFGRLSFFNIPIELTIHNISLSRVTPSNFLFSMTLVIFILPVTCLIFIEIENKKSIYSRKNRYDKY